MARKPSLPSVDLTALARPDLTRVQVLRPDGPAPTPTGIHGRPLPIDQLWVEHQPRELIPEERLQALIAAGEARPAVVLAALQEVAGMDDYYRQVLEELQGLACSIGSQGVLQPIEV